MADSLDTAAPAGKAESRPDLRLTTRYRWLLLLVTLPLFIVIMVLAGNQYRDQRAQVLRDLAQNTSSYSIALEGMLLAIGPRGVDLPPRSMTRHDDRGKRWRLALQGRPGPRDRIRLVARARGSGWFGETDTAFLQPGTRESGVQ